MRSNFLGDSLDFFGSFLCQDKNEQNYVIPTVVEESHDGLVPVVEISRFRCASLEMTSKCNRKTALRSTLLRDVAICRS